MKKLVLLTLIFCISTVTFSQDPKFGVRAALNISNVNFSGDLEPDLDSRYGAAFGFFGEYELGDNLDLFVEFQFSAEGSKQRTTQIAQFNGTFQDSFRLDYLQMPILFTFNISEDKFSLGLGPQVGLKVFDFDDGYQNIAFSGVARLEYMITDMFFVDARYNLGFTELFDDHVPYDGTNSAIQVGFGLKI